MNSLERWDAVSSVHTARDIRNLCMCECGGVAHFYQSIHIGLSETYHGRCYIARFGLDALLAMDKSELGGLTLNDIGQDAMRLVVDKLTSGMAPKSDLGAHKATGFGAVSSANGDLK